MSTSATLDEPLPSDHSDETVEDLTEDVFVKLYEKLDRYVERGLPFTAWLYRIAHNQLVDFVRTLPRHQAQSLDVVADVAESQANAEYRSAKQTSKAQYKEQVNNAKVNRQADKQAARNQLNADTQAGQGPHVPDDESKH